MLCSLMKLSTILEMFFHSLMFLWSSNPLPAFFGGWKVGINLSNLTHVYPIYTNNNNLFLKQFPASSGLSRLLKKGTSSGWYDWLWNFRYRKSSVNHWHSRAKQFWDDANRVELLLDSPSSVMNCIPTNTYNPPMIHMYLYYWHTHLFIYGN